MRVFQQYPPLAVMALFVAPEALTDSAGLRQQANDDGFGSGIVRNFP
jgi:hypothetical protein